MLKKNIMLWSIFQLSVSLLHATEIMYPNKNESSDTLQLDFKQAIELLNADNELIKASKTEVKQRALEKKAAQGLYLPNLGVSANYVAMSEALHLDLNPVKEAISPLYQSLITIGSFAPTVVPPAMSQQLQGGLQQIEAGEWDKTIQKDRFLLVDASVVWPVFTGGKIRAANKYALARETESLEKGRMISNQQYSLLAERYFGYQLAVEVESLRKNAMDAMQKHLDDARKMKTNGWIADVEVLHAEMVLADASKEWKKAKNDAALLHAALQNSLSTEQTIVPVSKLFLIPDLPVLDEITDKTLKNNPGLGQIEAKRLQALQGENKEKADWYPQVYAYGNKELYNIDFSEYAPDWTVGIGMKINIFDGFSKVRKTQAAKLVTEQVNYMAEKTKLDLQTLVTKIYQQMESAREQFEASRNTLRFALEYTRAKEKAFSEGMASSSDVTDAQLYVLKIRTEQLKALYDFDIALAHLLEVAGNSSAFEMYLNNTIPNIYEKN